MKLRLSLALLALQCGAASALSPQDFASGMTIDGDVDRPVWQLELPDTVYAGVIRPGLGDLRVFNAEQLAVPHAICSAAEVAEVAAPQSREYELPVFPLQSIRESQAADVDMNLSAPQGSDVHVNIETAEPAAAEALALSGYVIDASDVETAIVALRLRWISSDGASEVPVRVEASDNLDRWTDVVPQANLLRLSSASATLERVRIALPPARYKYLRLIRVSDGPAPSVEAVVAESVERTEIKTLPMRWFDAQARSDTPDAMFDYDTGRLAPIEYARISLPARNQLITIKLLSRSSDQAAWQLRWQGEQSNLPGSESKRTAGDIRFPATSDAHWRLQITEGREAFGNVAPALSFAYAPQVLRFVAQGQGPYTLAYGSARAESALPRRCDWWRQTTGGDAETMIGLGSVSEAFSLSGAEATKVLPPPTPVKRYLLWSVLVAGSALLVVMALSLLRRVRNDTEK